jgi:PIN domain nuclease of toxin-antitoxin system
LVVFDSWALLAYMAGEPSAERIESVWVEEGAAICAVNLGEVLHIQMRARGEDAARADVEEVRGLLNVIDPDWPLVAEAARVKAGGGLSYADAFCIATAERTQVPLWTGDSEIVARAAELSNEVVDLR